MKKIFLIAIGLSVALFAEFSRNDDTEIVTDHATGLQWQDNKDEEGEKIEWYDAMAYCEAIVVGGYSDWRLPNINELTSIIDYNKSDRKISPVFRYGMDTYWSSTAEHLSSDEYAWFVNFSNGAVYGSNLEFPFYIRCVRAGQ